MTELLKLAVRKIREVSEALGRGSYEDGAEPGARYRNGCRRRRLRTAEVADRLRRAPSF